MLNSDNTINGSDNMINGRYQIIHDLGEGGFGKTYLAKDTELQSQPHCVIKHLQPRFSNPNVMQSAKVRFAQEGYTLERLGSHPQIPQLFSYVEENEEFYLIQEWVDGEEIRREVEVSQGIFDETKAVAFLQDSLEVLSYIHQQGVIHRDIKPANLLRRKKDQKIVLIDFGAVKEIGTMIFETKTQTVQTQVIGTPGYMAPEQQIGKPAYSSDIYALGRTVIFALTGRSPIELEDTETGNLKSWHQSVSLSPTFKAILDKMIDPRLGERYRRAEEALQDLAPLTKVGNILNERYKITQFVGGKEGNYTYFAENIARSDHLPCVIKQLTLTNDENGENNRSLRELKALERVGVYKRIPKLLDHFEIEQDLYLVQEYIKGKTLSQVLRQRTCLSEEQVRTLLEEVLTTLDFIHQNNVIHRDLKPSNLIWQSDPDDPESDHEHCFLIDFGIVKEIQNQSSDSTNNHISSTQSVGTKGYMSPEQMAGRPVFASDIYGLGVTAIQALTGQFPEDFANNPKTGGMVWPSDIKFNKKLTKILEKMTCLEVEKRYSSAQDVLNDLRGMPRIWIPLPNSRLLMLPLIGVGALTIGGLFFYGLSLNQTAISLKRGDLELENGNHQSAINFYDDALNNAPPFASSILHFERAFLQKALAYSALGKNEEMLQTCEEAIAFRPESAYGWNCKGTALDNLDRQTEAIESFNKAIKKDPSSFEAWHNRGLLYGELENIVQAEADLKEAIRLNPDSSFVSWNDLGKIYYRTQDYPKAVDAYDESIKSNTDYLPSRIGLGNTYRKLDKYQAAIDAYNSALSINSQSDEAWYNKGLAEEALERYQDAYDSYDQARVIDPLKQQYRDAQKRVRDKM